MSNLCLDLHHAPKPHAFTSLPLQSVLVLTKEAGANYMRLSKRYDDNQHLSDVEFSLLISHHEKMRKQIQE